MQGNTSNNKDKIKEAKLPKCIDSFSIQYNAQFMFSRCGCEECMTSRQEDSLRHSRSRINSYRALASPSLIALSSKDPILTAFELSWELRRLSFAEHEFKSEYLVISMIWVWEHCSIKSKGTKKNKTHCSFRKSVTFQ